jgi:hypothetical protein
MAETFTMCSAAIRKSRTARYPVLDLVICHGDFLNADHEYLHKNRNIKGFGTYGDVMIRVPASVHTTIRVLANGTRLEPGAYADRSPPRLP